MTKQIIISLIVILFLFSCNNPTEQTTGEKLDNKYAKGFSIYETEDGYLLQVKNPYQGSENQTYTYSLSRNSSDDFIKIPVKKAICLSTTHIAFIDALSNTKTIVGLSSINHVYNKQMLHIIESGNVTEVGYNEYINYESIIALDPDVVFAYGIDQSSLTVFDKLEKIGIPVVLVGEYLENKALGRSEWIRFFSCFYDNLPLAEQIFDSISNNYQNLNVLTENVNTQPSVLTGLPWKGIWYVPGGNSFLSNIINDAGGKYIWADNNSCESIPLSIEEVFDKASNANIWLHPNNCNSKTEILATDSRLEYFKPINNAVFYNNNKRMSSAGGNDYWESGALYADRILKDLIYIIHPNLLDEYSLIYYTQINE